MPAQPGLLLQLHKPRPSSLPSRTALGRLSKPRIFNNTSISPASNNHSRVLDASSSSPLFLSTILLHPTSASVHKVQDPKDSHHMATLVCRTDLLRLAGIRHLDKAFLIHPLASSIHLLGHLVLQASHQCSKAKHQDLKQLLSNRQSTPNQQHPSRRSQSRSRPPLSSFPAHLIHQLQW